MYCRFFFVPAGSGNDAAVEVVDVVEVEIIAALAAAVAVAVLACVLCFCRLLTIAAAARLFIVAIVDICGA